MPWSEMWTMVLILSLIKREIPPSPCLCLCCHSPIPYSTSGRGNGGEHAPSSPFTLF